jgi:hypothetical protein
MSDYSTVKSYTIVSVSTSATELMFALWTHFDSAPGLWRVKAGTTSGANGIIIEPKVALPGYNIGVSIRRNGTSDIRVQVDPLNSFTTAGNATTAPSGGSALVLPEITMPLTNIASEAIGLSEMADAMLPLFYGSTMSTVAQIIHAGRVANPDREIYRSEPLAFNGVGCLVGVPNHQLVGQGFIGGTSAASRLRSNGGSRAVYPLSSSPGNSPIPRAPNPPLEIVVPIKIGIYHDASTNFSEIGSLRYVGRAGVARSNTVVVQHPTEQEAWLHVTDTTYEPTTSKTVIAWEKSVPSPTI